VRIGVNTAILRRGHSGTASVTRLIVDVLRAQGHDVIELDPPWQRSGSRVRNLVHSVSWDLWGAARAEPIDLLISPCNVGGAPRRLPHLLYLQDTMPLDHPEMFDRGFNLYVRALFGWSAKHATIVVTASEHSAAGVRRRWPSVAPRLRVVPWPVRTAMVDAPRPAPAGGDRVVLMLGATEPHKRNALGVEVVDRVRRSTGVDLRLQVIGPAARAEPEVAAAMAAHDPQRSWIERATEPTDAGVRRRLEQAWALLQCSADEGFCLPLVEAAAVALPAVHTGAGSMTEVHPAAAAADDSAASLAAALEALLDDEAYGVASSEALDVARRHSLAAFADRLVSVVDETLSRHASGRT
jgi:glycosyltransferase involved in cell wall biosynthesis